MGKETLKIKAQEIVRHLREAGYKAFIVGGAVRDIVMNVEPKDYDIVTDASTDEVSCLFERTNPVGKQFGVNIVVMGDDTFEVAQFRKDGLYKDGRRPVTVKTADEIEDVKRRDFTINGLLYDPEANRVIDHVSGIDDIHHGIIRTIGDPYERFTEDRLRILRAIRFATRFDFNIERETLEAIKYHAQHVKAVSSERIGEELAKMFSGNNPESALSLLDETGLLDALLPELAELKGVEQPPQFHPEGDVFTHTKRMLRIFGGGSVSLAFGILLHDIAKPVTFTKTDRIRFSHHEKAGAEMAGNILIRLRFGKETIVRVEALVKNHMRFVHVMQMKRSTLRRFMSLENFHEMLELYRIDCLASHGNLDIYTFLREEINKNKNTLELPKPLVNGNDLISLGYKQGPLLGTIMNRILDDQIEGELHSKEEAVDFILKEYPRDSRQ